MTKPCWSLGFVVMKDVKREGAFFNKDRDSGCRPNDKSVFQRWIRKGEGVESRMRVYNRKGMC